MSTSVKQALLRAARTFAQAFVGFVIASGILSGVATSGVVDFSDLKKVLVAAAGAGVSAVVAFVHNLLQPVAPPADPQAAAALANANVRIAKLEDQLGGPITPAAP